MDGRSGNLTEAPYSAFANCAAAKTAGAACADMEWAACNSLAQEAVVGYTAHERTRRCCQPSLASSARADSMWSRSARL